MDLIEENADPLSAIESRHRKEKKELQAHIQALKKAAKNDKSKKKDLLLEITRLEIEMEARHKQELEQIAIETVKNIPVEESEDIENGITKIKISKAQKRRDKKSQQDKQREELIKQQEKENLNGPRNKEIQDLTVKLKKSNLKMYFVPSDGDCLYSAVAHQLLITRNQVTSPAQLRKDVSNYIKQNKHDFLPFMTNPDTLDMLSDEEFQIYCNKIANTNDWGGQLEIRALSNCLQCPICVIQASGPESIDQGSEFVGPPLVITYHRHMYQLGEHYNSTVNIDQVDNDNEI